MEVWALGLNGDQFGKFNVQNWVPCIWKPLDAYIVFPKWISMSIGN